MIEIINNLIQTFGAIITTSIITAGSVYGYRHIKNQKKIQEETCEHTKKTYEIVNNGKLQKTMDDVQEIKEYIKEDRQDKKDINTKIDMIIQFMKK